MWKKAEKLLLKDKFVGPLIKKYGECKLTPGKKENYFIDLVEAICSQQLSGKAAATIFGRVRVGLGRVVPDRILDTSDSDFRRWGLSRQKIKYLRDLSEKVKRGELNIKKLDSFSDEEVIRQLTAVKGVGNWTAEMFLMFSLGRPDIFPVDDLGIRKSAEILFKTKGNSQKIAKYAERWKPYRTYASWYLWESLDNR